MKVTIVFPPSICLPNQMYSSLPMLAGGLTRGGHQARIVDLNLLAADMLLTDERTERYIHLAHDTIACSARNNDGTHATLSATMHRLEPMLRAAPESKTILRDSRRFFDQPLFRDAFWNVVDALGFFYQLDPVISPLGSDFQRRMLARADADPWTVMSDLFDEGLVAQVLDEQTELVGISVAFPEQAAESIRLAQRIRRHDPSVTIIFGGPLISLYPDRWLRDGWLFQFADAVCVGDGETAFVDLCDALEGRGDPKRIANIVWPDEHRALPNPPASRLEAMDDLPCPEFDSFDMPLYFTPEPIYPYMTSRGCYWGKCTFCSIGWRKDYRAASATKIEADVAQLVTRYQPRYLQVGDSSLPPPSATHLANAVAQTKTDLFWVAGMKFDRAFLSESYTQQLYNGGCRSLMFGFESSTQRLVDRMRKGFRVADVPEMLASVRAAGISPELLWFIGFPTETREEALATARFLMEIRSSFGLSAFVSEYQLHPDTPVYEEPERFGVTILREENGVCDYETDEGMPIADLKPLKAFLDPTNNRTLICNGSHLLHVAESGPDLSRLERPLAIPNEMVEFCTPTPPIARRFAREVRR